MGTVIAIIVVAAIVIAIAAYFMNERRRRAEIERREHLRKGAEAHLGRAEHHAARADMAEELLDRERTEAAQHESHAREMADEAGLDPDRDLDRTGAATGRTAAYERDGADADTRAGYDDGVDDPADRRTDVERDPATGRDVR
jgi:hypothetical protein